MDTKLIRQLWSAVQSASTKGLSHLDDPTLMQSLVNVMCEDPGFDPGNLAAMNSYIQTRLPLIRDIASQA
ncbi:MAG: hypothetical protein DCF25_21035 [Leptolyngbya foveolarum]|uniref:Uncharacterized protein n=1 Tax=Leptolyngbya foveolarum TaxID=47253 RepID=A0A2W4VD10_9CYAN|nr:MAG: hypothetical protein DCF25_21035 [Leptolyngbya foveolarum]